jgi:hypothetical protein
MNDSQYPQQEHAPDTGGGEAPGTGADASGTGASAPAGPGAAPAQQAGYAAPPGGYAYPGAPPAGQPQSAWAQATDPRRKSPGLAAVLALAPGLGHVYLGYYSRGFLNATVVISIISLLAAVRMPEVMYPLLGMFLPFYWLYNIVDAGRRAAYMNHVLEGGKLEELPKEFAMPKPGGSLGGGLALIVLGFVLLSHTLFDISLEWLEYWWPMLPVSIGIWLVAQALRDKAKSD